MRLIDANALLSDKVWLCGGFVSDEYVRGYMEALDKVETVINESPTIEAVPLDGAYVKQLRWERDVALQQLADIGCGLGRDMTDIKKKLEAISVVQKMTQDVESSYPKLTFDVRDVYPSEWILEQLKRTKGK